MKKVNPRYLLLLAAGASLAVGLAACGGGGDDGGDAPEPTAAVNGDATPASNGAQEVVVTMNDNVFEPKEIDVKVGEVVTFVAKNQGTAIHNMTIQDTDFKSEAMVPSGEQSTFEATFTEAGTYTFQCDYHVPDMVGTITVE